MNEISKNLKCIVIRDGIQIWVEADRADKLVRLLTLQNPPQFTEYDGRVLNRADIVGVFNPQDMEEQQRRKNGQWKCKEANWHDRGEKCNCKNQKELEYKKEYENAIQNCGKCKDGWIIKEGTLIRRCNCIEEINKKWGK